MRDVTQIENYKGKRVSFQLHYNNRLYGSVKGSVTAIDSKAVHLDDYVQIHLNNTMAVKPVETGQHKSFDRMDIKDVTETEHTFSPAFTNAYHPSDVKGSSEWWYWLLFDDSGKVMSGKLDVQGTKGKEVGASDLSIYQRGERPIFLVNEGIRSLEAETEKCFARVGDDYFYEKDGKYNVEISDGKTKLVLEGTPAKDDQVISIDFPLNEREGVRWCVPSFNGTYEGELWQGGKTTKVKGRFFHDHNRDDMERTLKFMKAFKGWAWGVQYQGDDALLYARCFVDHYPLSLQLRKKDGRFDVVTDPKMLGFGAGYSNFGSFFKGDVYQGRMGHLNTAPRFKNPFVEKALRGFGLRKDYSFSATKEEYFQVWRRMLFNKDI